jgi:hypothetical protein
MKLAIPATRLWRAAASQATYPLGMMLMMVVMDRFDRSGCRHAPEWHLKEILTERHRCVAALPLPVRGGDRERFRPVPRQQFAICVRKLAVLSRDLHRWSLFRRALSLVPFSEGFKDVASLAIHLRRR